MAEPFLGEIKIMAFGYPPRSWAQCDGQLMSIQQNQALYSLLGVQFGGDGKNNFALPNLQGRVPLFPSNTHFGTVDGYEGVTLSTDQIPSHFHYLNMNNSDANQVKPDNHFISKTKPDPQFPEGFNGYSTSNPNTTMSSCIGTCGDNAAHTNIQPSLVLNFCIALAGVFPSRN
ncbi:MAG: phage tail protein [Candidatus Delongbacteria bacterium]|nr:phage tail protein [Candidatus Delongbacteria bacterium]